MVNKILVTGGSGMVGKSLRKFLNGYNTAFLSSKDLNLLDEKSVELHLKRERYNTVIHLAAKVGGIMDNIAKPEDYFIQNVQMNTNILKWSRLTGVGRFIGILSTCIYPDIVDEYPMTEDVLHKGPPTPTNFSYGYAKRCLAVHIDAMNKQHNTKYQYLIPCNLYGEFDKFGENSHFIAALIKKIHIAKTTNANSISLFGSGTPLRQFMYSGDLAKVIKTCIDEDIYDSFNVATEENLTIKEMANIALDACDAKHLNVEFDSTKPDGQYRKDVSTDKMFKLLPNIEITKLYDGIKYTYQKVNSETLIM